jgi:YidC/Oxa1 family membrane protein insertase
MEKRLTLALFLCLAFLFVYQSFMVRPKPVPEPAGGALPAATAPDPEPARSEAVLDPKEIVREVLENEVLRIVVTNAGAAIESAELKDFWPSTAARRAGEPPLRMLVPSAGGLHALRVDELRRAEGPALGSRPWTLVRGADGMSVVGETTYAMGGAEGAEARLRKEIRLLDPTSHAIGVELSITLRGPQGSSRTFPALLQLVVSGGVFQEGGQSAMSPPFSVVSLHDGDVKVVGLPEVMKRDGEGRTVYEALLSSEVTGVGAGVEGPVRFAGDLGTYLGAIFVAQEFPASLVAQVFRISDGSSPRFSGWGDHGDDTARTATLLRFEADLRENADPLRLRGLYYLGPLAQAPLRADLGRVAPREAEALAAVDDHQLGWARAVGKVVLFALRALHGLVGSWGWAIVLLTVCVRIILFPVNRRSQLAMARQAEAMARLKPRLDELKKKHEKDPRAFAAAQMELMKREKVSLVPLGGCLPIFLQIPIFFGLFAALRNSLDLRQATWLWVEDLSKPDHLISFGQGFPNPLRVLSSCCGFPQSDRITGFHILPLLMTAAWVGSSLMAPKPANMDPQMAQQRKIMTVMPVFFGLTMYGYAAGLSLYWLTSSLMGMAEARIIRRFWPVRKAG